MSLEEPTSVYLGRPAVIEFSGPDAVRFLNGQVTQDVRRVLAESCALPSCITDAKGKLQFRVMISSGCNESLRVSCAALDAENLLERLTRYLIADDVEVHDLSGNYQLVHHFFSEGGDASYRYGKMGWDQWIASQEVYSHFLTEESNQWQAWRIRQGIPQWGHEITAGMLPPEAALDQTDISYQKGCYIGQEVISRIKSAGKVNQRLTHWLIPHACEVERPELVDEDGHAAGRLTSISPEIEPTGRHALGYLKRSATAAFVQDAATGQLVKLSPI